MQSCNHKSDMKTNVFDDLQLISYLKQSSEVPCIWKTSRHFFKNFTYVGDLGQNNGVCVLEIVDVIQGDEQVNDGQMIEGGVNPEQLRMEMWRGGKQLCCPFKWYHIGFML